MGSVFAKQYGQNFDAKISARLLNLNRQNMVAAHERFAQQLVREADELRLASVDSLEVDVAADAYKLDEAIVRRRANEILASSARNSNYNSSSALDVDGLLRGLTPAQHADMLLAVEMAATSVSAVETMDILGSHFQRLEDFTAAVYWYTRAATDGYLPSILNLSDLLFRRGKTDEAAIWWERAAALGHIAAMCHLGGRAEEKQDWRGATLWYEKVVSAGSTEGLMRLAFMSQKKGDSDQEMYWFTRAADAGVRDAMYNLGNRYWKRGSVEDALTWYGKAADAGDEDAMLRLGEIYIQRGDRPRVVFWLGTAAELGNVTARDALRQLRF